ncbi:MAG: hypothetical protein AB8G99_07655 [Planctomycetaceae bacterium]
MVEKEHQGSSRHEYEGVDGTSSCEGQLNQQILEEVLQETISQYHGSAVSDEDIGSLQQVSKKYGGKDLDIEILRELIQAMLGQFFEEPIGKNSGRMINTIADSMFEDPTALLRVEKLWKRLSISTS